MLCTDYKRPSRGGLSGNNVEDKGGSLAKDLSASARAAVPAIIHAVARPLAPWIEDQPRLYTCTINSARQRVFFPSLQTKEIEPLYNCALTYKGEPRPPLVWEERSPLTSQLGSERWQEGGGLGTPRGGGVPGGLQESG